MVSGPSPFLKAPAPKAEMAERARCLLLNCHSQNPNILTYPEISHPTSFSSAVESKWNIKQNSSLIDNTSLACRFQPNGMSVCTTSYKSAQDTVLLLFEHKYEYTASLVPVRSSHRLNSQSHNFIAGHKMHRYYLGACTTVSN